MCIASSYYLWPLAVSVALLNAGCRVPGVDDLRPAGIEVVDPATEAMPPELSGWSSPGRLVKLSFFTKTNVRDVAKKFNLHLRAEAYFCGNRAHELAKLQVLFDGDGVITESPEASRRPESSQVWFYIAEKSGPGKDIESGTFSIPPYDLVAQPKDVCVQLHGRNMALEGFSSNVATITSTQLTRALAQDPM
jgi:hypothetical protein